MKRAYTTTNVIAGGVKVSVRQQVGSYDGLGKIKFSVGQMIRGGDKQIPQIVAAAAVSAQLWLNLVIPARGSGRYRDILQPVFRFCFHADATPENANLVWSVLSTVRLALTRPFAVKVIDMDGGTLGYVRRYYTGCVQMISGVYNYDSDGDLIRSRGEIHLAKSILNNGDLTAVTLIHEAGHKFASLRDHSWAGYFSSDYKGYEENTLTWQQCLVNADSYAVFVYLVANPHLARMRVPGLVRAARRAEADEVDYSGISNLFG